MRAVVQRVTQARVDVGDRKVGAVDRGVLVLVGVMADDTEADRKWMVRKLLSLRIFPDDEGRMNRSLVDIGGSALLVSQFTVCADVGKGTRPSFSRAMPPAEAREEFERLVADVGAVVSVETGEFQAMMAVSLVNDGPVTLWLDSKKR